MSMSLFIKNTKNIDSIVPQHSSHISSSVNLTPIDQSSMKSSSITKQLTLVKMSY
jgi:hypothetical protein